MKIKSAICILMVLLFGLYAHGYAADAAPVPDEENPLLAGGGALAATPPPSAGGGSSSAESMLNSLLKGKAPDIFRNKVDDKESAQQKHQEMIDQMQDAATSDN